jgi:hypothetical protein
MPNERKIRSRKESDEKKSNHRKNLSTFFRNFLPTKDTSIFKQSHFTEIVGRFKSQFFVNSEYNTSED